MKLIDKGNGKNFYFIDKNGKYIDIIKVKGEFYRIKFSQIFNEIIRIGMPIKVD